MLIHYLKRVACARRVPRVPSLVVFVVFSAAFGGAAMLLQRSQAAPTQQPPSLGNRKELNFTPGEILVRFRDKASTVRNATQSDPAQLELEQDGQLIHVTIEPLGMRTEIVEGLRLARVSADDTLRAVEALRARSDVLYAEPNYIWKKMLTPNDPRFGEQTNLRSTSSPTSDIDAEQAWDITTGSSNVAVGIIDEGIDINHTDLAANIWTNPGETPGNGIDDDANGFVDDIHGWDFLHHDNSVYDGPGTNPDGTPVDAHGTHVAGIIGAVGNNNIGIAGINWQVTMVPMKFIGPNGGSTTDLLGAYDYALKLKQAWESSGGTRGANLRILNNSYGGFANSQAAADAIRILSNAGILFIVAAGNESSDNDRFPVYPANYKVPNIISVGSSDSVGQMSFFSNFGQRTVDMLAPGSSVLSTIPGNLHARASGTSASAPHVTGTAALVLAAFPGMSMKRLRAATILGGTIDNSLTISRRRLNARGSLDNAAETDVTPPAAVTNLAITSQNSTSIGLRWNAPGDDGANGTVSLYEVRFSDTDFTTPGSFEQGYRSIGPPPAAAGGLVQTFARIPFRHLNGFIGVRAVDNVGNEGPISVVPITSDPDVIDPYILSQSATEALSTGGTPVGLKGDDRYQSYQLPFDFTFFGQTGRGVTLSTNGAIHFGFPQGVDINVLEYLSARPMIAGLWDDLRTDRRPDDDIYVVSDPTKIIFRWQAVTFDSPTGPGTTRGENPVNFEIELDRDGAIKIRYADGNHNVLPVVGVSGGEPDSYVVDSHTSELTLRDLTLAPTVVFTRRRPIPLPNPDLSVALRTSPDQASSGQNFTYIVTATNLNQNQQSEQTVVTNQLPSGVTFVSCTTQRGTCSGPPVGSTGTVTAQIGTLVAFNQNDLVITVQVNAAAGTTLTDTAAISGFWTDPVPANNTASIVSDVRDPVRFDNVIRVSAGGKGAFSNHTIALKSDGTVWAWGANFMGQLGDGTTFNSVNVPALVPGLGGVVEIDAGGNHSLALKSNNTIWAWGENSFRQSGETEQQSRPRASQIAGLTGAFIAISAGEQHSLALRSDGTVWGWGGNGGGQLGNGSTAFSTYPPVQASLTNVIAISAGSNFSLALKSDGTVWGFGGNPNGALGQPINTPFSSTPLQVNGLANVKAIAAGGIHSMALKQDGTVWSWGENSQGQLGSGEGNGSFPVPRQVVGLTNVVAIAAGYRHSLALKSDGSVWAWGNNVSGQLGNDTNVNSNVPVLVANLTATSVTAGNTHSGALLPNGTIRTWGSNANGELGDRTTIDRRAPVEAVGSFGPPLPSVNPDGGVFNNRVGVTVSCATVSTLIYYTTDGSEPTASSGAASSGATLTIDHSLTLKSKCFKPGWPMSPTKSSNFTINLPSPTPTPTPVPGAAEQPIAFTRETANGNDVFLMNADGTGQVNITNSPGDDSQPAWAPNATRIAFSTTRPSVVGRHLATMQPDGSNLKVFNSLRTGDEGSPAYSPDGNLIAFIADSAPPSIGRIVLTDPNGFFPLGQTNNFSHYQSPNWSPDGTKIAFSDGFIGQPSDILVLPAATLFVFPTNLTNDPADDVTPKWSPDGTRIAFSSNRSGDYEIYVMNPDGSSVQRLTTSSGADRWPAWSPDGTKIIFASERDGNSEIYLMNADGSNQTRLTNNTVGDTQPVWRMRNPSFVQFSAATFTSSESAPSAHITVTRTGDLSSTVSVDYSTIDDSAAIRCDDQVNNNGQAYARCDYASSIDSISFLPGQTTKTIDIPLVDDAFTEASETVQLQLSNVVGGNFGNPRIATLTITDNDGTVGPNPIFSSPFFVRQQYLDFLSREPEPDGFEAWLRVLNNCSDVNNNPDCDRIIVSSSFFRSQEFQLKGFFVFKFYRLTLGRLPTYDEISRDMRKVTGQTADEVFAKRDAFAPAWVLRDDYRLRFDNLNNMDFIDQLLRNIGLDDLSGPVTRETLLNDLNNSRKTRAQVLRALVDHADIDAKEYNNAFVAMQYYGYLRRTPETDGYQNWLNYLNSHPTDFRTMVNGFMNSIEYRLRFGPTQQ